METIAVLGGPFTYSDLAAPKGYEKIYFPTLDGVFDAVESGKIVYGIVPLENLLQGPVEEVVRGLAEHDIEIVREIALPIEHCLIRKKSAKGTPVSKIVSHPQALAQCDIFIRKNHPDAELITVESTAEALTYLEKGEKDLAAIGSKQAAQLLNLDIERQGIGNQKVNRTLFMLIKTKKASQT